FINKSTRGKHGPGKRQIRDTILELFSPLHEDLWATLPPGWQEALCDLSAPQIANLLLDNNFTERCYPSVWPLSLLAFRTSAHILAFSRRPQDQGAQDAGSLRPEEFHKNNSQSSLLGHIFRKHVKPKKQHEIRKLGALVKTLCDKTCCKTVVDVGSGQGHLTRFLSFGLGLSVTGIEADAALVSMARKFDEQLLSTLKKQIERKVTRSATVPSPNHVIGWVNPRASWEEFIKQLEMGACERFILTGLHACGDLSATLLRHFASCPHVLVLVPPCPTHSSRSEFGYPMSSWVRGLPGHQLSYKAREGACHAIEDYVERLRTESGVLKTHCYRAVLETVIRACRPDLRRAGIQTIKKAHLLPFSEYARLGLPRVGLPSDLPLDHSRLDAMLQQKGRVVVYFSLVLLLAPVVETLVLLDRMLFLQERGLQSQLVPLFDPAFSPRNLVLVAVRPGHSGVAQSPTA
uniref:Methyltransferase like 25B n=1 Tax=Scleropages formosus TaxID=113540 RepID=A0A8C9W0M7_SCLFO